MVDSERVEDSKLQDKVVVKAMKDEEEKDDSVLCLLILARAPGADRHTVSSIAVRPNGLSHVLQRFDVVRRRHIWPSGGVVHDCCPLLCRLVLDNDKFEPGNRIYWEMKEGLVPSRYPDLLRTLSKAWDPGRRRLLFESHRRKMGGITGNPARQLEPWEIRLSRQ